MTTTPPAKKAPPKRPQPYKPAGVREPQDHKPPAQREAEGPEYITVEWGGLEFEILSDPDELDFFAVSAPLAQGNIAQGLIGLLGQKQITTLRKMYPKLKQGEARELYDVIIAAMGFGSSGN